MNESQRKTKIEEEEEVPIIEVWGEMKSQKGRERVFLRKWKDHSCNKLTNV